MPLVAVKATNLEFHNGWMEKPYVHWRDNVSTSKMRKSLDWFGHYRQWLRETYKVDSVYNYENYLSDTFIEYRAEEDDWVRFYFEWC